MPTFETSDEFRRQYQDLTPSQRSAFKLAVAKLVADLRSGVIRPGLRVKRYRRREGVWEMTWADDGRALFRYGPSVRPGDVHVIWLGIGGHEILEDR